MKLTDCYYEKKDWRACKKEVSRIACEELELYSATEKVPRRDSSTSSSSFGRVCML
ncbi:hypothetical protein P280DRAFT_466268, partial [Massarina eburnea CBS 473.64]